MLRNAICAVLSLSLRIFFRRIEIAGKERVPKDKPVIFVLNHPNGLVDPVFLLCLSGRPVSFLAKEPLFRMPLIGSLVRSLDALPVYRQQDQGADTSRNTETFVAARKLLSRGGALAICPEGISHDEPRLKPIKSGAARIALGAASTGRNLDLQIVPAGLYYTSKMTFRSSALLYFGDPLSVEPVPLEKNGEPARTAVAALSERIETALRDVMLHAEHEEGLTAVERAERIFSAELPGEDEENFLSRELELRKLFLNSYAVWQVRDPIRLETLDHRLRRYEEQLTRMKLEPDEFERPGSTVSTAVKLAVPALAFFALTPFAMVGLLVHYPAYRLTGFLAKRLARDADDIVSTIKIIASMLFFPLTWVIVSFGLYLISGWKVGLVALLLVPLFGFLAIRFFEELDQFIGAVRSLTFYLTRRRYFLRLLAERKAIFDEMLKMGEEPGQVGSVTGNR